MRLHVQLQHQEFWMVCGAFVKCFLSAESSEPYARKERPLTAHFIYLRLIFKSFSSLSLVRWSWQHTPRHHWNLKYRNPDRRDCARQRRHRGGGRRDEGAGVPTRRVTDVQVQLNKALQLEYRLVLVEFFPLLEDLRTRLCRISHLSNLAVQVLDQRAPRCNLRVYIM